MWLATLVKEPPPVDYVRQIRERLPDLYAMHPRLAALAGWAHAGVRHQRIARSTSSSTPSPSLEPTLAPPVSVRLHGDFNTNNIVYDAAGTACTSSTSTGAAPATTRRTSACLLVSNLRQPIQDPRILADLDRLNRLIESFAAEFARLVDDAHFEIAADAVAGPLVHHLRPSGDRPRVRAGDLPAGRAAARADRDRGGGLSARCGSRSSGNPTRGPPSAWRPRCATAGADSLVVDLAACALRLPGAGGLSTTAGRWPSTAAVVKKIGDTAGGWAVRERLQHPAAPRGERRPGLERARIGIEAAIDRSRMTVELVRAGLPVPETVITEDVAEATAAVERFGSAVLKPLFTSKGRGMQRLDPSLDLPRLLARHARPEPRPVLPAALRQASRAATSAWRCSTASASAPTGAWPATISG